MALAAILAGASLAGKLLGRGGQASAEGRRSNAYADAQLAAINNRNAIDTAQHNLNVSQFNLQAPSVLGRRGVGASALMHYTPGGSHPGGHAFANAMHDPSVRDQILARLVGESGEQLRTGAYKARPMAAPAPVERRRPGMLEKIGGWAGTLGGIAGGLAEMGVGSAPRLNIDDFIQGGGVPRVTFGANSPDFGTPGRFPNVRFR